MKLQVRGVGRLTSSRTASIKVAETQMEGVRQGEPAVLAFRNRKEIVGGKVSLVHPEVANGTFTVEVTIEDALPPGVNLEEPADGVISVGGLTNVVYVSKPVFGRSNSRAMLFRLEPDGRSAKKVPVQFGAASVQLIEIKNGLHPGDKVIVSDMSQYDAVASIALR